jgi:cytoskeleton protein RodZ
MNNQEPQGSGAAQARAAVGGANGRNAPGAQLMAARRAQGLSLGDVARQLKLSVRQIEALERDDYSAFAGPVFVRGFLRNYAKLLQLDPDAVVSAAAFPAAAAASEAVPAVTAPVQEEAAARGRRIGAGTLVAAAVLLVLVVAALYETRQRPSPVAPAPVAPSAQPAASPEHAESPPGAPADEASAGSSIPAAPPPAAGPVAPAAPAATPATGPGKANPLAPAPAGVAAAAPASAGRAELRLMFDDESWVEIKDKSGIVIFSRLNAAGSERMVEGEPPLTLVIGNAHAVRLSFRSKPVDLGPHTRVDVARVTLE